MNISFFWFFLTYFTIYDKNKIYSWDEKLLLEVDDFETAI